MRSKNRKNKAGHTHKHNNKQAHSDLYTGFLYNSSQLKYSNKYQIKKDGMALQLSGKAHIPILFKQFAVPRGLSSGFN